MNLLIRHIEYLISRTDCVIIPGLGALLAQYNSAVIDNKHGMAYAPKRSFKFNSDIAENDGILAHSISLATGMSFDKAMDFVSREVDSLKHQLYTYGELSLGKVGMLKYDDRTGLHDFIPYAADRLSVATFWLPDVRFTPLAIEHSDDGDIHEVKTSRNFLSLSRVGQIAASIALLFGIWFLASTPISVDDSLLAASLAPEISRASDKVASPQQPSVDDDATWSLQEAAEAEDIVDPIADAQVDAQEPAEPEPALVNSGNGIVDEAMLPGKYYIIVAASGSEAKALELVDQLRPLHDLRIVPYGRRYLVYSSAHDSAQDASSACLKAREDIPGAWIANSADKE